MRLMNLMLLLIVMAANLLPSCEKVRNGNPEVPDPATPRNALSTKILLIVVDGLRSDYVKPEYMPNLYALAQEGVLGEKNFVALSSETRVNAASISAGSYPSTHGLIANYMWDPAISADEFSTGDADNLDLMKSIYGQILTSISGGQAIENAGLQYVFCGTSGSGTSLLMNPHVVGKGIYSTGSGGFFRPDSNQNITQIVGAIPSSAHGKTAWAFDVYLHDLLSDNPSDIAVVWVSELDASQHSYGVGSPEALAAVSSVDQNIGNVVEQIENLADGDVNIFITGDHGFTTSSGNLYFSRITDSLAKYGVGTEKFLVAHDMIYLKEDENDIPLLKQIVEVLQRNEDIGAIYTKPLQSGSSGEYVIPGTIPTSAIHWNHVQRSPSIFYSADWNDNLNAHGFPGETTRGGVATHGSSSPYDIHVPLVAIGPDIKDGVLSEVPTGNVDLMPTILHLAGITPPSEMEGRVIHELLEGGPSWQSISVVKDTVGATITYPDGFHYQTEIIRYQVDGTTYFKGAYTHRSNN